MQKLNQKAVIFDLDGVLVDTGQFHRQSWYELTRQEGWPFSDEFFSKTFGMQNHLILPILAGRPMTPAEIKHYSDWKEARYRQLNEGKLQLLPGVRELLSDLKQNHFQLAIGTSTPPENLQFIMQHTRIADFFDAFVDSADVTRSKPDPDTFLKAAAKLNMDPARCVVVEDAPAGVQAGKAGGMPVIAVTNTRPAEELAAAGADRIIASLTELSAGDFDSLLTNSHTPRRM